MAHFSPGIKEKISTLARQVINSTSMFEVPADGRLLGSSSVALARWGSHLWDFKLETFWLPCDFEAWKGYSSSHAPEDREAVSELGRLVGSCSFFPESRWV